MCCSTNGRFGLGIWRQLPCQEEAKLEQSERDDLMRARLRRD
jgi:hypothetical protein